MLAGLVRARRVGVPAAAALVVAAGLLSGCGSSEEGPAANAGGGGAFPVTVEHKFGSTEIPARPTRVVTLGLSDQDAALALGVTPIAVTDWYGDYESAVWPWAQDLLGETKPTVLEKGKFTGDQLFNYEQIAKLEPDLIIGLYVGIKQEQYDKLTEIAPTVAQSADFFDYGMPWQEITMTMGEALGLEPEARALIADVDAEFAAAAKAHPEFAGLEAIVAERFEAGLSFARGPQDPRTRFMTALGFELPKEIADLAGDKDGTEISDEQMSLLDRDILVWNTGFAPEVEAEIQGSSLYQQLDVVEAGHDLFVSDPVVSAALTWSTVVSLPYALEKLVPELAATVAK